jgi:hypothetical protein
MMAAAVATAICPALIITRMIITGGYNASFLFSGKPNLYQLFYHFYVGSGLLQGLFQFFDRDYLRIIINGIYLFKGTKAFFDFKYAIQPFQGLFAYIKSRNDKNDLRLIIRSQCILAY